VNNKLLDTEYVDVTEAPKDPPPSTVPGVTVTWSLDPSTTGAGGRTIVGHTGVTLFNIRISNDTDTFGLAGPTNVLLNGAPLHGSAGGIATRSPAGFAGVSVIEFGSTLVTTGANQVVRVTVGGVEIGRILIDVN
jgi:hypothetical protein